MYYAKVNDAFLDTEMMLHYVTEKKTPFLHEWTSAPTCILGQEDTQLNHFSERCATLQDYDLFVRSSGGRAVISEPGVLNLSLFLPDTPSIDTAYEQLYLCIQKNCNFPLLAGEVINSYCPGNYDIHYQGKKIAGMSQKRGQGATVVMAYISLYGNQQKRGKDIQRFYSLAQDPKALTIHPETMASLSDWQEVWKYDYTYPLIDLTDFQSWMDAHLAIRNNIQKRLDFRQKQVGDFYGKSIS